MKVEWGSDKFLRLRTISRRNALAKNGKLFFTQHFLGKHPYLLIAAILCYSLVEHTVYICHIPHMCSEMWLCHATVLAYP